MVRAKFYVTAVLPSVLLQPVVCGSKENEVFFKYTPGGQIRLDILSEETVKQFEVGVEYYVDFTKATPPENTNPA